MTKLHTFAHIHTSHYCEQTQYEPISSDWSSIVHNCNSQNINVTFKCENWLNYINLSIFIRLFTLMWTQTKVTSLSLSLWPKIKINNKNYCDWLFFITFHINMNNNVSIYCAQINVFWAHFTLVRTNSITNW